MAPFDFNQNPAIPGTMPSNRLQAPQSQQGGYNQDFSGQLNDMLAPYQQMAQRLQSPYATMRPDSWLARNHPQVAGMLDNAFLTMGSTPSAQGPEGVGGGISRTMQGLMGAQQYRRQQMMQNMMMPYQMMMPQLQAQDMMSQIGERKGSALRAEAYNEAMVNRFGPGGLESQKLEVAQQRADQAKYGRQLSDPMERMAHDLHPFKDPQNPTQEEYKAVQQEYEGMKERTQRTPAGSWEEQIFQMQNHPDPAVRKMGDKAYASHIETLRAGAGARTGAETAITAPIREQEQFLAEQNKEKDKGIREVPSMDEFSKRKEYGLAFVDPTIAQKMVKDYAQAQQDSAKEKGDIEEKFAKWQNSPAYNAKVPFHAWLANPGKYDNPQPSEVANTPGPTATPGSAADQWDQLVNRMTPKK